MKIAMRLPKISIAERPISWMIFSSWRIESWPRSRPDKVIRIAKKTRL